MEDEIEDKRGLILNQIIDALEKIIELRPLWVKEGGILDIVFGKSDSLIQIQNPEINDVRLVFEGDKWKLQVSNHDRA